MDSSAESLSEDSVTEQEEPMLFPCPGSVGRWETKHFIGMALQQFKVDSSFSYSQNNVSKIIKNPRGDICRF